MTEQIKQRQPLIELKDVTKTYHDGKRKDVFAVSNFNLTLYEGETLGLVGESGCGKSTIGNMLVHLLTPDEGSILFRGQDITSMNERQFHPTRQLSACSAPDGLGCLPTRTANSTSPKKPTVAIRYAPVLFRYSDSTCGNMPTILITRTAVPTM